MNKKEKYVITINRKTETLCLVTFKIHNIMIFQGVGYGGKDDTGSKDPASRGYRNGDDWDDEDE